MSDHRGVAPRFEYTVGTVGEAAGKKRARGKPLFVYVRDGWNGKLFARKMCSVVSANFNEVSGCAAVDGKEGAVALGARIFDQERAAYGKSPRR